MGLEIVLITAKLGLDPVSTSTPQTREAALLHVNCGVVFPKIIDKSMDIVLIGPPPQI